MLAVYVNCITIIVGSLLGALFSKKISSNMSNVVQDAAGIITIVIGLQMAFQYKSIIYLSLSLILGGLLGSYLNIDDSILKLGNLLSRLFYRKKEEVKNSEGNKNFAYAFLNSSVLFCVGAMAIIGSLKAGIEKDYTIIFTKSILDGFMAIVFTASMGIGTLFSFVAVFVYQGLLTLLSVFVKPFVTESLTAELSACGGAMIVMIGINLLNLKKIKTANFLPSIILIVIFVLLDPYIKTFLPF